MIASMTALTTVLLVAVHVLASVFWVGGMAFAYLVLRPAAGPLEPPARLALWRGVFGRFLPAVGAAIVLLLVSGFGIVFHTYGGFAATPLHVHLMTATGSAMMLVFLHIVFAPWKRFRIAVEAGDFATGAASLAQIRRFVAINLALGVLTVVIGSTGRYW